MWGVIKTRNGKRNGKQNEMENILALNIYTLSLYESPVFPTDNVDVL